ncbi:MAG: zinc-dependent alcohol dehydrogenase [Candidatus Thorarchaeota archaeon]|jgi:threonine dehydrogenase-like Zn-dependent dehydrogenase
MKAARNHKPGDPLKIEDVPEPEIGNNDVLIKMKAAAICPSDLPLILGQHMETRGYTPEFLKRVLPYIPGHENTGVVEKIGKDVLDLEVGDRVITIPSTSCGACYFCNVGRDNLCVNGYWTGMDRAPGSRTGGKAARTVPGGGWAEYLWAPSRSAFKLPDNLSFEDATIISAMAPGVHGAGSADLQESDTVLVFGAGAVVLYAMHFAKVVHGASMVIGVDLVDYRLDFAKKYFGADYTINAATEDVVARARELTPDRNGVDVAIEAVGYTGVTVEQAIDSLRLGGTLVHVGSYPHPPKNYGGWKELKIIFGMGYAREDYRKMLRLAGAGRLELAKSVTHKTSLDNVNEGVEITDQKKGDPLRVVINKF